MVKEWCRFSQVNVIHEHLPHRINVLFLPNKFYHPHTQTRITLFHRVRIIIFIWKPSPSHVSIGLSQIAFPTIVLLKDARTNSFQEERLGLPYWTMIWAICVVVDESMCLDILTLEFSVILKHLRFLPGYKQILRQLLVLRTLAVWKWYPWFLRLSFVTVINPALNHCVRDWIISYNVTSEYDSALIFLKFWVSTPNSRDDRCPLMMQSALFSLLSLLQRSPFSCFWLSSAAMLVSFSSFSFLYLQLLLYQESSLLAA